MERELDTKARVNKFTIMVGNIKENLRIISLMVKEAANFKIAPPTKVKFDTRVNLKDKISYVANSVWFNVVKDKESFLF